MGETAASKKWLESTLKGREWFIWTGKRSEIYEYALGWNDGGIWGEEILREKMNIMKPYNEWRDTEIGMIWDLEEWIEMVAVYAGCQFPYVLCGIMGKSELIQIHVSYIYRIVPCPEEGSGEIQIVLGPIA